jgi:hypothetical protein
MLRALFSTKYLQQLLREGKLINERIFLYILLLNLFVFPCLCLAFVQFYTPKLLENFLQPILFYGILTVGAVVVFFVSQFFIWYFTTIFNYQEQRILYSTVKTLYRFHNALLLVFLMPIVWYARVSEVILFVYMPLLTILIVTFFIRFIRNIDGISRIHFFIYFCSLEILPYILLIKLFIINV